MKAILIPRQLMLLFGHSALAVLLLCTGCCVPAKVRTAAVKEVTTLKSELAKEDQAHVLTAEAFVRQALSAQRAALRAQWQQRRAEITTDIYRKFASKFAEQRERLVKDLEAALDPALSRIKSELEAERAKGPTGAERANALALQLSATLAVAQRETAKADADLEKQFNTARDELINAINEKFNKVPESIDGGATPEDIDAVMKPIRDHSASVQKALKEGFDSLTAYIELDSPLKLFAEGLLGKNLFDLIQPSFDKFLNSVEKKVTAEADDFAKKITSDAEKSSKPKS